MPCGGGWDGFLRIIIEDIEMTGTSSVSPSGCHLSLKGKALGDDRQGLVSVGRTGNLFRQPFGLPPSPEGEGFWGTIGRAWSLVGDGAAAYMVK